MSAQAFLPWDSPWRARAACLFFNAAFALWAFLWIHRSYRARFRHLEAARADANAAAAIHSRTIEALALAIDGKDLRSLDDIRRVEAYAVEIGNALELKDEELRALRAAALLRDIGKLGVPEHIVSKPGCLTPAEFEKMRAHPLTGCQILEQVGFPYPVAPIVRSHHEKWDGSGYPGGLFGEEIPIGARILAAADALASLVTNRPGRSAMSLEEAVKSVASKAGRSFDPRVVEVIEKRYREFRDPAAPATGGEVAQELFDLTTDFGRPLSLSSTLSILETRLARMVPYHAMAVYACREGSLALSFAKGVNSQFFSGMEVGEGLSGRVAETREPMVNGNPGTEPGCLGMAEVSGFLRSALSVPLENPQGLVGVLTLYHGESSAFTSEHLRLVQAVAYGMAQAIQTALECSGPLPSSATDSLTGLPNGRALFLHLDRELARSKRTDQPLTVLVTDLNGLKEVNDRFGRPHGDRVLKLVAQRLRECCREYDFVSRMGEDEFVLVFPDRSPELVDAVRTRLFRAVTEAGREVCGEEIVRASFGEGQYPCDGQDAEELLVAADRRVFANKQDRRSAFGLTKC